MAALLALWSKRWTLLPLFLGGWNTMQWLRRVEGRDASHWLRAHPVVSVPLVAAIFVHLGWWKAAPIVAEQ